MLGVLRGAFPVRGTDSTRSEGDKTPCWCPRVFGEELVIVSGSHRTKYLLKKPSTELFLGPVMGPIAHSLLSPRITMLDTLQFGFFGGVGVGSKEKGNGQIPTSQLLYIQAQHRKGLGGKTGDGVEWESIA